MTRRLISFCVAVVLLALAVIAARGLGRWLVRQDPLAHAAAIVVLSGGLPYRAEEAANLFRMGYAPEVWVTRASGPGEELRKLGIAYTGEEDYERQVLMRAGVPQNAVRILPEEIINTEQEMLEVAGEMRQRGLGKVIIVTSPPHTRRVRTLWARLAPADRAAVVRAAFEDPFDAAHWWHNTRDAMSVSREMLGLVNAWAGLPVRPHGA